MAFDPASVARRQRERARQRKRQQKLEVKQQRREEKALRGEEVEATGPEIDWGEAVGMDQADGLPAGVVESIEAAAEERE